MQYEEWKKLLDEEIRYWEETVSNNNGRFHTIEPWFNPYSELQDRYRPYVTPESRIIDVGAAICTKIGKRLNGKKLNITAVDVLATEYNEILAKNDIIPPVTTRKCDFESLVSTFGKDSFDFVHCSNAIDHCHNPLDSLQQLYAITKPGGYLYVRVHENEALNCNYLGLHQFNFYIQDHGVYYADKDANTVLIPFTMQKLELVKSGNINLIEFIIKK